MGAGRPRKYASAEERYKAANLRRSQGLTSSGLDRLQTRKRSRAEIEEDKQLGQIAVDHWLTHYNQDRAFSTFGRYDPADKIPTIQVLRRKDRTQQPTLSTEIHIAPVAPKFHNVTPEDIDWATKQKSFGHSQSMPRPFNTFCAVCVEMVIDKSERSVRVTKGVYLPIEHKCGSVRVYDLRGNLLETKQL